MHYATQLGANATHKYVSVAVVGMDNSTLAYARLPNCYTIFLKQIIPCKRININIIIVHICMMNDNTVG